MRTEDLDRSVHEIGLSAPTARALVNAGIETVRDLIPRTVNELCGLTGMGRNLVNEIIAALAKLGLSLGTPPFVFEGTAGPPQPPAIVVRVLAGETEAIDALVRADVPTWQALLEHLVVTKPAVAPAGLIDRILEREPSPARWHELAKRALLDIRSLEFVTSRQALKPFWVWFGDGILAARGSTSSVALELRVEREESARAIVDDARATGASRELLASALQLLARQLADDDDHLLAIDVMLEAESYLGDPAARGEARRQRAASLLRLRRFDEAFAILDEEMTHSARGPLSYTVASSQNKLDAALEEAATIARWASATTAEWVRALGGIAQHADSASKPVLWQRFERALVTMVETSANPGSDLETVIRQAKQRRFLRTARAAADVAKQRRIAIDAELYY